MLALSVSLRTTIAQQNSDVLEERAFKEAVALVADSVVRIETVGGVERVGQLLTGTGATTGLVLTEDGYIISSVYNFVSRPSSILVRLADGRVFPAKQVATDHLTMLTLLKIDAEGLVPAEPAELKSVRVGQWTIAVGRTFDPAVPNVSTGIVSALNRMWGRAIQTDAKVSPTNYGGPLIDLNGKVIGILAPLSPQSDKEAAGVEWYDSGIGFAVPLQHVRAAFDRLSQGKDLRPGLMGISFRGGSTIVGDPVIDRVRIASPADKADLETGDVVTAVDGRKIVRAADFQFATGLKYENETVSITVRRGDKEFERQLTLVGELLPYESAFFGILPERRLTDAAGENGVGVRHVFADSPAVKAALKPGDRIVKWNGATVGDAATLLDLVGRSKPGDNASVAFVRNGKEQTQQVVLGSIPSSLPAELSAIAIPARDANVPVGELKLGRFNSDLPESGRSYWSYVPENYNPAARYGLVVWMSPAAEPMEAEILRTWKSVCDSRGLILVAPRPGQRDGWTPEDLEFVKQIVDATTAKYSIDPARVLVHGYDDGGGVALVLAFKHRSLFRGASAVGAALGRRPPDNDPAYRLQLHFACGSEDPVLPAVEQAVQALRQMKYPVILSTPAGRDHSYLSPEEVEQVGLWADCLDRI